MSSVHVVALLSVAANRQGLVPGDEELLSWLRRNNPRPLVLAANKADTRAGAVRESGCSRQAGRL